MAVNTSFVVTILGPDKPGLIEGIASAVSNHGGNWVESRMAHLAGQFAGIIRIEVSASQAPELRTSLEALDLSIQIAEDESAASETKQVVTLDVIGQDQPGIVRQIARTLAAHGVNVEELETECTSAPWSGETLFKASAHLSIPEGLSLADLRTELETIANDLMVDVELKSPEE